MIKAVRFWLLNRLKSVFSHPGAEESRQRNGGTLERFVYPHHGSHKMQMQCANQQQVPELGRQSLLHIYKDCIICHSCLSPPVRFPARFCLTCAAFLIRRTCISSANLRGYVNFRRWKTHCPIVHAFMVLVPAFCFLAWLSDSDPACT